MTFDALLKKETSDDIKGLYKKCKKDTEFEFIFYREKGNPLASMNSEHFIKLLGYLKYISDSSKLKLVSNTSLDVAYSDKKSDNNYRATVSGLANINKYMNMFNMRNNYVILKQLVKMQKNKEFIDVIKKTKSIKNIVDIDDFNIRIRLSDESKLSKDDYTVIKGISRDNANNISFRYKQRVSVIIEDNKDVIIRIDITNVKMSKNINNIHNTIPLYELELEISAKKDKPDIKYLNTAYTYVTKLLKYIQQSNYIISKTTEKKILDAYANILSVNLQKRRTLAGRKPVSLEIQHVVSKLPNNYAVTDKADGERFFLIIIGKEVYMISSNHHVKYTGITLKDSKYNNTILDGEYIFVKGKNIYLYAVFDCLFSMGKDLRNENSLLKRLEEADKIIKNAFVLKGHKGSSVNIYSGNFDKDKIMSHYNKDIKVYMDNLNHDLSIESSLPLIRRKYFIFPLGGSDNEIFIYSTLLWNNYTLNNDVNCPYILDGLIYQPVDQKYIISKQNSTYMDYKWKPPSKNSIDFYITFERNNDGKILTLYDNSQDDYVKSKLYKVIHMHVGARYKDDEVPVLFRENENRYIAHIFVENGEIRDIEGNIIQDNTVVEFYYNNDPNIPEYYRWIPMKTRHDKTENVHKYKKNYGNYIDIADKIWNSIKNPILMSDFDTLSDNNMYRKHFGLLKSKIDHSIIMTELQDNQFYKKSRTIGLQLKRYYDWIKSATIYEYCNPMYKNYLTPDKTSGPSVLDIGCGRGDDIMKYYYTKTSLYIGVDIDEASLTTPINGAISRYNQLKNTHVNFPSMGFLHADVSTGLDYDNQERALGNITVHNKRILDKYFNPKNKFKFERISCQFSISKFLKNSISWNNFINNINNNLKKGGMMLITTMDGDIINNNLKGKDNYTISYTDNNGNNITFLHIVKKYDTIGGLGNMIEVHNATEHQDGKYEAEYLVNKKFLISEFKKKCNLHLVDTILIKDEYDNHKEYFENYVKYEANVKTRAFLQNAGNLYEKDNDLKNATYKVASLNRFYLFEKA